jgi:hypothetical protein
VSRSDGALAEKFAKFSEHWSPKVIAPGTVNTGEVVCEKTAATDAWI